MPTTTQDDLLDDLLVQYLAALDVYQAAQARLAQSLKESYFDLARSKQALGPTRMSQSSYDLGETLARVAVSISPCPPLSVPDGDSDDITSVPPLEWTLASSASSLAPPPAPPSAELASSVSKLRQRSTKTSSSIASTRSALPLTPTKDLEPTPRPLSRSPLLQFSAFPPPALRDAERGFGNVARAAVEIAQARGRIEMLERRIEGARGAVKGGRIEDLGRRLH